MRIHEVTDPMFMRPTVSVCMYITDELSMCGDIMGRERGDDDVIDMRIVHCTVSPCNTVKRVCMFACACCFFSSPPVLATFCLIKLCNTILLSLYSM